jgi:hypothetical protein
MALHAASVHDALAKVEWLGGKRLLALVFLAQNLGDVYTIDEGVKFGAVKHEETLKNLRGGHLFFLGLYRV